MALCDRCQHINFVEVHIGSLPLSSYTVPKGSIHSDNYATLRSSASTCPLCSILIGNPSPEEQSRINDDDCVSLLTFSRDRWPRKEPAQESSSLVAGFEVRIGPKGSNVANSLKHVPLWADENSPDGLKKFIMLRPCGPVEDPRIPRKWLSSCLRNHPHCKIPSTSVQGPGDEEPVVLPTRVIDVGISGAGSAPVLVETQGLKGKYATLSHCWGTETITRTLKGNLQDHLKAIPEEHVSANFRHAFQVCRDLAIRYLWIDALCILQDDDGDWDVESGKMAQYYSRAVLTISAANSSAAAEGFLTPRPSRRAVTLPFLHEPDMDLGYFTIGEQLSDEIYRDGFRDDVEKGPLSKRGWTLQERLLSRRNLFFGREEFHWECRSERWSESSEMMPIRYVDISAGLAAFPGLPLFDSEDGGGGGGQGNGGSRLLDIWYAILQMYTQRSLTKKHLDKLPALSGIAKVLQPAMGGGGTSPATSYCAGLWSHDFPRALLWKSFGPYAGGERVLPGPSWSWVSRDARIFPGRPESGAVVSIDDISWDVTPSGTDAHGRVSGGTVRFRGYIKEVTSVVPIALDDSKSGSCPYPLSNALVYHKSNQIGAAVLDDPSDVGVFGEKTYAVPIRQLMTNPPFAIIDIEALLLQTTTNGTFRRIGVMNMMANSVSSSRDNGAPFAEPFQAFFYEAERQIIVIE